MEIAALAVSIVALLVTFWSRHETAAFRKRVENRRHFGADLSRLSEALNEVSAAVTRAQLSRFQLEDLMEGEHLPEQLRDRAESNLSRLRELEEVTSTQIAKSRATLYDLWDEEKPSADLMARVLETATIVEQHRASLDIITAAVDDSVADARRDHRALEVPPGSAPHDRFRHP
jgi:hypothetical protein